MMNDVLLVCFNGPESTGKSEMAKRMAKKYNTEFVPEVAREIITSNEFNADDIIKIGNAQTDRVLQKVKTANKILFCDSDLITTQIYAQHYLGEVPPVLYELEEKVTYDLYFLFDIDVPWEDDGLRDLGSDKDRQRMFSVFKSELEQRGIAHVLVKGDWKEREQIVVEAIDKLLT